MTPEEKAKRYKESLERAKIAHKDEDRHLKAALERIFPELKEDKDEKIRKALLSTVKYYHFKESPYLSDISKEQALAWLEKQGEHANFRNKIQIGDKVTRNENGELVNLSQLNRVAKKNEKQGEQKPQGKTALEAINEEKVDNANKVEPKDYSSIDPHFGKPIDKVEPKFKAGDWIVWQDKYFKVNYNGCGYELIDQNGKSTSLEYGTIDENAHIWDIAKDAKGGDVIATKDAVFIFKHIDKTGLSLCKSHCEVIGNSELGLGFDFSINGVYPATKEQRDKLEKAMADAGYTIDFEKKKLKKNKNEIEITYGAKDSELQEDTYYIPKGFHAEIDDDKVVIKKGEKPTWSEMDKAALGDALWAIEQAKTVAKNENDMGNIWYAEWWLKSLKYKIYPKNGYNPYKEVVESIAKMCEKYDKYSHSILKDFFNNVKAKCKDAKEFDSLHPQNAKTISQ